jgi:phosphate transport system protein
MDGEMSGHKYRLEREIGKLKKSILGLSAVVENAVHLAVKSVAERDEAMARAVIEGDAEIDQMEVDLEEDCLKLLALYQPVAIDLRYIVAVLKINSDLERIGDLALNIAERAVLLAGLPPCEIPFDFQGMAEKVKTMLRSSLDALVTLDPNTASEVCRADDEVDAINREMYLLVEKGMRENPRQVDTLMLMLGISRLLERIADHATNISEDVIYMTTGQIVRHNPENFEALVQQLSKS